MIRQLYDTALLGIRRAVAHYSLMWLCATSPVPPVKRQGWTIAAVAIAVVAAAAAGYGAYASAEAAEQQASAQKKSARLQAEAEAAAGEARRRQKKYEADRFLRSQLSRAAAGGVQAGEGSLLEGQMEAAQLAEYDANMAAYPHKVSSQLNEYQAKLFGWQARNARDTKGINTGVATAGSLATSYSSYSKYKAPSSGESLSV